MKSSLYLALAALISGPALAQSCPTIADGDYRCANEKVFTVRHLEMDGKPAFLMTTSGADLHPVKCNNPDALEVNEICTKEQRLSNPEFGKVCQQAYGAAQRSVSVRSKIDEESYHARITTGSKDLETDEQKVDMSLEVKIVKVSDTSFHMSADIKSRLMTASAKNVLCTRK